MDRRKYRRPAAIGITRREFVKGCLWGACAFAAGYGTSVAFPVAGLKDNPAGAAGEGPWKWSREALFYEKSGEGFRCRKCPNECLLGPEELSRCRNRQGHKGKLYTIAYGNPCAVHIDPIEKKPLSHFLPTSRAFSIATAGCMFACLNCQNWEISQFSPRETRNYDLMPDEVVKHALAEKCAAIAYTYSEPTTFYEYAYDTAKLARRKNIRNVWKSNGYINEEPLRKVCKVLDAANIDLKSFDDNIYVKLNSGALAPVLRTLKILKEEHVWLEITNLVIPNWTDDMTMIRKMCDWLVSNGLSECPLHFSRFFPLYRLNQLPPTPVSVLEKARETALASGIKYAYIGNVPGHSGAHTYCHNCKKLIIERRGFSIDARHLKEGRCGLCGERIPGVWSLQPGHPI